MTEQPLSPPTTASRKRGSRLTISGWIAASMLCIIVLVAVFAPLLAPFDPTSQDLSASRIPPVGFGGNWHHPFGTDVFGRDLLSRILFGARVSLFVGVVSATVSMAIGTALGLLAGYHEGRRGATILRLADIQFSLPFYAIAIAVVATFGPGLRNLVILLSLWGWASYARTIAVSVAQLKRLEYVQASRLQWSSALRIMRVHILPGVSGSIIILWSTSVGVLIMVESALSFIGLGVQIPDFSWGSMLAGAQSELQSAWWIAVLPGVALTLTIVSFYILGDALRDALNLPIRDRRRPDPQPQEA